MEPFVTILLILLGLMIQFALIIVAIRLATEKERKYHKIQTALFASLARKAGINEQEIADLFIKEKLRIL